jgi:hypothetical protein
MADNERSYEYKYRISVEGQKEAEEALRTARELDQARAKAASATSIVSSTGGGGSASQLQATQAAANAAAQATAQISKGLDASTASAGRLRDQLKTVESLGQRIQSVYDAARSVITGSFSSEPISNAITSFGGLRTEGAAAAEALGLTSISMGAVATAAGVVATALVGIGLASWTLQAADAANTLERQSAAMKITAKDAIELDNAYRLSGTSSSNFKEAVAAVEQRLKQSGGAGLEYAESLRRSGIESRTASGIVQELLRETNSLTTSQQDLARATAVVGSEAVSAITPLQNAYKTAGDAIRGTSAEFAESNRRLAEADRFVEQLSVRWDNLVRSAKAEVILSVVTIFKTEGTPPNLNGQPFKANSADLSYGSLAPRSNVGVPANLLLFANQKSVPPTVNFGQRELQDQIRGTEFGRRRELAKLIAERNQLAEDANRSLGPQDYASRGARFPELNAQIATLEASFRKPSARPAGTSDNDKLKTLIERQEKAIADAQQRAVQGFEGGFSQLTAFDAETRQREKELQFNLTPPKLLGEYRDARASERENLYQKIVKDFTAFGAEFDGALVEYLQRGTALAKAGFTGGLNVERLNRNAALQQASADIQSNTALSRTALDFQLTQARNRTDTVSGTLRSNDIARAEVERTAELQKQATLASLTLTADQRKLALEQQLADLSLNRYRLSIDRETSLIDLQRQREAQFRGFAEQFVTARQNGSTGGFFRDQAELFKRQVEVNAATGIFRRAAPVLGRIGEASGIPPELLKGTILDPEGAKLDKELKLAQAQNQNTASLDRTRRSLDTLTATIGGLGSGGGAVTAFAGTGLSPELLSVLSDGNGIAGQGGIGGSGGGLGGLLGGVFRRSSSTTSSSSNGGFLDALGSVGRPNDGGGLFAAFGDPRSTNTEKLGSAIGSAAAIGLGSITAVRGFREGGARGTLGAASGILGVAASIPGPQQPFLQAGALIAGVLKDIFPSRTEQRRREQADTVERSRFTLPASKDVTAAADGGGVVWDRSGRPIQVVLNINAMDARSIAERGREIADVVAQSIIDGHSLADEIRSTAMRSSG